MKNIIIYIFLLIPVFTVGQINPFKKLRYDKVVAYEFQGEDGLLIKKCLKEDSEKINKKINLTFSQIKKLETMLTSKSAYGNTTTFCFNPHFAVVYYKNEKIIGTINICLDCNYLISSEKIPATELKMIKVSDGYSYPAKGFSKNTRKKFTNT